MKGWSEEEAQKLYTVIRELNNGQLFRVRWEKDKVAMIQKTVGTKSTYDVTQQLREIREHQRTLDPVMNSANRRWSEAETALLKHCLRTVGRDYKELCRIIVTKSRSQIQEKIYKLLKEEKSEMLKYVETREYNKWNYHIWQVFCEGLSVYFKENIPL